MRFGHICATLNVFLPLTFLRRSSERHAFFLVCLLFVRVSSRVDSLVLLLAMQSGQLVTQALIFRGSPAKKYLAIHSCIIFVIPGCLFVFPCSVDKSSGTRCFGIMIWLCVTDPSSPWYFRIRTPSFIMILSSCLNRFRPLGSVLRRCLSYSSCDIRSFNALRRGSASCSFLIRAFSLIAPNE